VTAGERPFLTAQWRHLAMLNFAIDPQIVRPLVPVGTELDTWCGRTLVSIVGFLFVDTRVLGYSIPNHRDFEEVNLRFYVRRRADEGWRRGVVFVKEIVPRAAIALAARLLYGENYVALRMQHRIAEGPGANGVSYSWWLHGREHRIEMSVAGPVDDVDEGSEAAFITDHYWGYAGRGGTGTTEYRVEHPRWRVSPVTSARLQCDVGALYGSRFAAALEAPPTSAFLAEGSEVAVFKGRRIRP
jgi:uncharacterized protein YqjF (DUF2071 family)